jgi:acyl-CoA reductase-like NAD-dependent aldehyde dehydrogenase
MHQTISEKQFETFFDICDSLAQTIEVKKSELIQLLTHYETHETAEDEILRSIEALSGMRKEFSGIKTPLENLSIATFFPLNLPLYSLILFAIAPSAFAQHIFLRPPEVMHEVLHKLWDFLELPSLFPNISLKIVPRHIFVSLYAADADAIIFTGKYENALNIHEKCPEALLLYNGSGINPFLLFENADISLAVKKAVEMRCFNSGQDCAGPDAFFVPASLAGDFTAQLEAALKSVNVGDTTNPTTDVGPTVKVAYIDELKKWLTKHKEYLVYGGSIDTEKRLVQPSIVRKRLEAGAKEEFHEFFAPFFYVLVYESDQILEETLTSPTFKDRGMYISVFGDNPQIEAKLDFVKILRNTIINDAERGNEEYGGYGAHANFLLFHSQKIDQPVLISRDLHQILG